jgi:O-methyltransferase involved in polyketide biosynthesis
MSETKSVTLNGVPETSLIPLYIRAMETQRPDALIKDGKAVELVKRMSYDFDRIRQIPLIDANKVVRILESCEFDRRAQDFLRRHPGAVVVHIGCGLDSRFERVDNGQVVWYDLDLPDIIDLRRKLIGNEPERYHLLGYSVFDDTWLEVVSAYRPRPFLFLAESVFFYFPETQVKSLVLKLCDHFPGAELVFDACSPLHVWVVNRQISRSKLDARLQWGIWSGKKIEGWGNASPTGASIRLLDEWGFFDRPEPRLAHLRLMRPFDSLAKTLRIYHFQLGKVVEGKE